MVGQDRTPIASPSVHHSSQDCSIETSAGDTSSLPTQSLANQSQSITMCYYEQHKFSCADWKWGNFRQHCQREYRTGETCGMKLVYQTLPVPEKCTLCEKIERKKRRYDKARADLKRWEDDPRFWASADNARKDLNALEGEIARLTAEKQARYINVGNPRRG